MTTEVQQDTKMNRFELLVDGSSAGEIDYQVRENTIVLTHTEIDPAQREEGLGGELVRGALNLIRADTDYRVVPSCPFAAEWISKHPEYDDLLSR
ncbi:putative GNAT family acetyltransferase [Salinibacterium sp. CAN_S4]|uniref:GNAT family N-acetyltransferase n=1 Tax=Salinibacterium sp. CAN_S4 TaxID=2787727 RepID=UPI0018EFEB9D